MRHPALALGLTCALLSGCLVPSTPTKPTTFFTSSSSAFSDSSVSSDSSSFASSLNTTAPLFTVFLNFSSPYSKQFVREQLPRLMEDVVTPGKIRLQLVPFALKKYPLSTQQAINFECGRQQGKDLAMTTLLATQPLPLTKAQLTTEGLDVTAFVTCLKAPESKTWIEAQAKLAADHKVTLVPTFVFNQKISIGLSEYADLSGWIGATLSE